MRRMCFDIESNYYRQPASGIGEPAAHRAEILAKGATFHAGVVYDAASKTFHKFTRQESKAMVSLLMTSDELISHSGRRHDVPILEYVTYGFAAMLRPLPHWDLFDLGYWQSLNDLSKVYVPTALPDIDTDFNKRLEEINLKYPGERWGSGFWYSEDNFQETKAAKARYDVVRTYAVWEAMINGNPYLAPSRSNDG